jgi:flagellar hook-associated protein 3 FlgL
MSIDRVATNSQSQFFLSQIMQANNALDTTQQQVSSGKVSTTYAGIGDKTAVLEAARATAARADGYQSNTQLAQTQVDQQNTQLTSLSGLADQLRQAVIGAAGNGDGTDLMTQAQSIFDQASQILNSKDANGNYIYGGGKDNTEPFSATSLSDLTAGSPPGPLPAVSSFFANGTQKKSVAVADGQSVQIGVLASDVGSDLMTALQNLSAAASSNGGFSGQLSQTQIDTLTSDPTANVLASATTASTNLNTATAANGYVYNQLQDASAGQQSLSTLYKGFVSNIEDVDMPTALTQLNQNQVALQAALQVTAQLGQLSLLNYLPAPTATG